MSDAQTCLLNLFSIGRNFDHHEGLSVPPARTTSPGVMGVAWRKVPFLNPPISRQTYRRMPSPGRHSAEIAAVIAYLHSQVPCRPDCFRMCCLLLLEPTGGRRLPRSHNVDANPARAGLLCKSAVDHLHRAAAETVARRPHRSFKFEIAGTDLSSRGLKDAIFGWGHSGY
jgi:hypothetical protein